MHPSMYYLSLECASLGYQRMNRRDFTAVALSRCGLRPKACTPSLNHSASSHDCEGLDARGEGDPQNQRALRILPANSATEQEHTQIPPSRMKAPSDVVKNFSCISPPTRSHGRGGDTRSMSESFSSRFHVRPSSGPRWHYGSTTTQPAVHPTVVRKDKGL